MSASPILRLVHREQALHSLPELRDSQVMARIIQRRIALGRLVSQRLVQLGGARIEAAGLDLAAADAEASA